MVLRVPAEPRYARVVRVAVSAYAVRLGLAPAAVEDMRLAVDEALILLMGSTTSADGTTGDQSDSTVVVILDAETQRPPLVVELHLEPPAVPIELDLPARSRFEEIIPSNVAVDAVDQRLGRVVLRHAG